MATASSSTSDRITARVPHAVAETLQRAAELSGATLNQFLVQSALEKARGVIDSVERERRIGLAQEDAALLVRLLENPPKPTKALAKAIGRYKSKVRDGTLHTTAGGEPPAR